MSRFKVNCRVLRIYQYMYLTTCWIICRQLLCKFVDRSYMQCDNIETVAIMKFHLKEIYLYYERKHKASLKDKRDDFSTAWHWAKIVGTLDVTISKSPTMNHTKKSFDIFQSFCCDSHLSTLFKQWYMTSLLYTRERHHVHIHPYMVLLHGVKIV